MTMKMKQSMGAMGAVDMTTDMDMSIKALSRTGDVTSLETRTSNGKLTLPPNSPMAGMKAMVEKNMSGKVVNSKMNSHYGVVGDPDFAKLLRLYLASG